MKLYGQPFRVVGEHRATGQAIRRLLPQTESNPLPQSTPPASGSDKSLTVKQQREQRRAAKVALLKKQEAAAKRNRLIGIISAAFAGAGILALIIVFIVTSATPKPDPATIDIEGLQTWDDLAANHVEAAVDYDAQYGMNPPAGGDHNGVWLNCGIYEDPQPNENAVHSLEHGAIWVTYDPSALDAEEIAALGNAVPSTYSIVSPYENLPAPIVVSAWGGQVQLDSVDDERLESFITKYWKSASAPEPGAVCTGGVDGPGKAS